MEVRRGRVLLIREQPIEFRLLGRGGLDDQQHVVHVHRLVHLAPIVLGLSLAMEIAGDRPGSTGIHRPSNTVGWGCHHDSGESHQEDESDPE
jgi:hypothetical protein